MNYELPSSDGIKSKSKSYVIIILRKRVKLRKCQRSGIGDKEMITNVLARGWKVQFLRAVRICHVGIIFSRGERPLL